MILLIGILIILTIGIIAFPFWKRIGIESFDQNIDYQVKFEGKRWTIDQIHQFRDTIHNVSNTVNDIQSRLHITLDDYKRLMTDLERSAYEKKRKLDSMTAEQKELLRGTGQGNLTNDPITQFYSSLRQAKIGGKEPIAYESERGGYKFRSSLPKVSIPELGTIETNEYYSWTGISGTERWDAEETFYKHIEDKLPPFASGVDQVLENATILRHNAGGNSWGILPRVEKMKREADAAEAAATKEGFLNGNPMDSEKCQAKTVYLRIIKVPSFDKWIQVAKDIQHKLKKMNSLVNDANTDLKYTETIINELKTKGQRQRNIVKQASTPAPAN